MSKSNSFENTTLKLFFQNLGIANIGDAGGLLPSVAAGSFYLRLHTDAVVVDDATIGTEAAYTGYVSGGLAIARSVGGWTVVANTVSNAAVITFGTCTAGSEVIRYASLWKDNSSTDEADRIYHGQLTADLAVSTGITPEIAIGAININVD